MVMGKNPSGADLSFLKYFKVVGVFLEVVGV